MEKRYEAPPGGLTAGEAAPRDGGDALLGSPAQARPAAGARGGAQQAIGTAPQGVALTNAGLSRSAYSTTLPAPCGLHARPELDSDTVGTYMRDAIERGGYRAALAYYGSDEAKESDTPWHRLGARGWLIGRLGLYDQMEGWLEEALALPDFDHLADAHASVQRTPYRPPAMWLEKPRPVQRSADHMLTVEPAAAPDLDIRKVPDHIWTAMLILDAAGPICSYAGLGAAAFLARMGADLQMCGTTDGDRRYSPHCGARLHGAPEACHRWIIADIDFEPWLINEPHYYYDLTDEGRGILGAARAGGAPWPKALEEAASGLAGMTLPDLLENACRSSGPHNDLGKTRDELARLLDAWDCQEKGTSTAPVCAEDQALVDLGAITNGPDSDGSAGSALDHLLCLVSVAESTHKIACEARPPSNAEMSVLQALIGALQDMCRRHAGALVAGASLEVPDAAASARSGHAGRRGKDALRRPLYSAASSSLICDLYYCLGEYCESRSLAADPCRLPPSEQFTKEEKAAVIEALAKDNPLYDDTDAARRNG